MSNVLLGLVGVILFIGMALAGASYFGSNFRESILHAEAGAVIQPLAALATAVQVRNSELELLTPAGTDLASLVPNYLAESISNPLGGPAPQLVAGTGSLSGDGSSVIMKVVGSRADRLCSSINKQGGGADVAPSLSAPGFDQTIGCFRLTSAVGSHMQSGDFVAYATIY